MLSRRFSQIWTHGADANDAQAVQTMPSKYPGAYDHQMAQNDANAKLPDTNIKFYPTTKHFEVAQKVTPKEFAEYLRRS